MSRCEGTHAVTNAPCSLQAQPGSPLCKACENRSIDERFLFASWMDLVTWEVEALCGLSPNDLSDCPYHNWYDAGMTPQEAAEAILQRCLQ